MQKWMGATGLECEILPMYDTISHAQYCIYPGDKLILIMNFLYSNPPRVIHTTLLHTTKKQFQKPEKHRNIPCSFLIRKKYTHSLTARHRRKKDGNKNGKEGGREDIDPIAKITPRPKTEKHPVIIPPYSHVV